MEDSIFLGSMAERKKKIEKVLNTKETFDILEREITVGGKSAVLYMVDGFLRGEVLEKIMEFFYAIQPEDMPEKYDDFVKNCLPYGDIITITSEKDFVHYILSGLTCMLLDGYTAIVAMDLREYPSRSVEEPDKDKVLRGSRDGFVEAIMQNTALIRRRIRDANLIFEIMGSGRSSETDISVVYMKDRVNQKALAMVKKRLQEVSVDALTMNQESVAELLMKRNWWNPYPKFKYTERPDTAAASLLEGSVVILADNTPTAMIIPTSLFEIIEDPNDYYFPPITGTYLRMTRMVTGVLALFLTPVFLLLLKNPQWVPGGLQFILIQDEIYVPPLLQLLILELAIDGLRMAAVNTPTMLTTPLSIVAGIVFGDYTVNSGWFNSEIMLYMAFVAVANYTQSNMELGYAVKFQRIILLLLTNFWGLAGFILGSVLTVVAFLSNTTMAGKGYLYPLIPWNGKQLCKRFFRVSLLRNEKMTQK